MKICMLSPFSDNAPSTLRLLSFGRELVSKGHAVYLIQPNLDKYSGFRIELNKQIKNVIRIHPYQFKTRNFEMNMLPYVFSSIPDILSLNFDVVHILKPTPWTCQGLLAKLTHRVPVVQDIDDIEHAVMTAEKHPKIRIWMMKQLENFLPRRADHILTISPYVLQTYIDLGIKPEKLTWLSNGVDTSEFQVAKDYSIKAKYGLREKVLVYSGSLNNSIQAAQFIKAMELIAKQRQDTSYFIIGDGSTRPYLQELTTKLKLDEYVKFAGRVPHQVVPKLLSICDIGLHCFAPPIRPYGGGLKISEYMASGLPVVVSCEFHGDLPYYLDFGKAGIIADFNINRLSSALIDLLNDDEKTKKLGAHAREFVKENFDWKVLTEKLVCVYKTLV